MDGEGLIFKGDRLLVESAISRTCHKIVVETVFSRIIIIVERNLERDAVCRQSVNVLTCTFENLTISDYSLTSACSIIVTLCGRESSLSVVDIYEELELPISLLVIDIHLRSAVAGSVVGENGTSWFPQAENITISINGIPINVPVTTHLLDVGSTRLFIGLNITGSEAH